MMSAFRKRLAQWADTSSSAAVWGALCVVATGFASILLGWAVVAGQSDTAGQVRPFAVFSGGGFALVCIGTALVVRVVIRRDAAARERHVDRLLSVFEIDEDAA